MTLRNDTNIISTLVDRFNGTKRMTASSLPAASTRRIDDAHKNITRSINMLRTALKSNSWRQIENAVEVIILKLLDNHNPDAVFAITPTKRLERELFVQFGGMQLLLKVLEPPFSKLDARLMPSSQIQRHVELWNEVLVILREVCFAVPSLTDSIFSDRHLVFLFTLLSHDYVFENTMSLLEEILAVRQETFCLQLVPDFYQLVGSFSTRRLAHFCRVLALLLFEPEDRQFMENAHVLRSYELLGLRRARMSKWSSGDIERNQCLVMDMPGLLARLVTLMRLANHGPSVAEARGGESGHEWLEMGMQQGMGGNGGLSAEQLFMYHMHTSSFSSTAAEWQHYDSLENSWQQRTRAEEPSPTPPPSSSVSAAPSVPAATSVSAPVPATSPYPITSTATATALSTLSTATSLLLPADITDSAYFGLDDMDSDDEQEQEHGSRSASSASQQRGPSMSEMRDQMQESLVNMLNALQPSLQMPPSSSSSRAAAAPATTSAQEDNELRYQALALAPHQVELLFVLCTLLSGRRKLDVQDRLAALGLGDVLLRMFTRMAWEASASEGPNPLEHIHGPDCSCNPESALRVQFLRLVHNFADRDFHNNTIPHLYLSAAEQQQVSGLARAACSDAMGTSADASVQRKSSSLLGQEGNEEGKDEADSSAFLKDPSKGLLSRITRVLINQPYDSVYRFWLSSCVEGFLRSTGPAEQCFLARPLPHSGLLQHLVQHITSSSFTHRSAASVSNLQTSFDLLGEMVRYNPGVVEQLEWLLVDGGLMDNFLGVVLSNLVDSNVFLRSLVLTVEKMGREVKSEDAKADSDSCSDSNYVDLLYQLPPCCLNPTRLPEGGGYSLVAAGVFPTRGSEEDHLTWAKAVAAAKSSSSLAAPTVAEVADVSYLTHSWLQFSPPMLSLEAMRVSQLLGAPSTQMSTKRVAAEKETEAKATRSGSFTTSLSGGMRDAFKILRDNVANTFTLPSRQEQKQEQRHTAARSVSSNISLYDFKDAIEEYEHELESESSRKLTSSGSSYIDDGPETEVGKKNQEVEEVGELLDSVGKAGTHNTFGDLPTREPLMLLSPASRHLSSFLHAHRATLVYRLMCVVTLRSVNHENICCINSALLIFVFARRRGCLLSLMDKLRRIASSPENMMHRPVHKHASGDGDDKGEVGREKKDDKEEDGKNEDGEVEKAIRRWRPSLPAHRDHAISDWGGLHNFRELLWYWREYYLRRGRDRLSLEFYTHIHFDEWLCVVEMLCADDGTEASLLSAPPSLPLSPYAPSSSKPSLTKYC